MEEKRIIPCLDLKNGRIVKGVNFEGLVDAGNPVEVAKAYQDMGADEIVLLDISATVENRSTFFDLIEKITKNITIPVTLGGGIKTLEDFEKAFLAGASKVSINSEAFKNPNLIKDAAEKFSSDKVVVAIDVKKVNGVYNVLLCGGKQDTGTDVVTWAKRVEELGASEILLTSLDGDGTKSGFDIPLLKLVTDAVRIPVIASGGAGKKEDFLEAFEKGGADAGLAASLFHFGELRVDELKDYLIKNGVLVK